MLPAPSQLLTKIHDSPSAKRIISALPRLILTPFAQLPVRIQQSVIKAVLSQVLKASLLDTELDFLQHHYLEVIITDAGLSFYLSVDKHTLIIESIKPDKVDVSFQGDSNSMLMMMSREVDPDTLFFQRKLLMTGDTELGLEIKNFLDDFDMSQLPKALSSALTKFAQLTDPLIDRKH